VDEVFAPEVPPRQRRTTGALARLEWKLGKELFDYQLAAAEAWEAQPGPARRLCLYYKTGAGKSATAMILVALSGFRETLVIAPPITHPMWVALGVKMGVKVTAVSHAKFRQQGYLVKRDRAVIADEFHLFGGHDGKGWKKLDRLAKGLQAPLMLLSATPNYNDAERVYCIQHILAPGSVSGGFIQFLYTHCVTEQNQFGMTPIVTGFQKYASAAEYLADLDHVLYVPDDVVINIADVELTTPLPAGFELGLDLAKRRIMASQMEVRHARARYLMMAPDGRVHPHIMAMLDQLVGEATTPVLIFCNSSQIAKGLFLTCLAQGAKAELLTGQSSAVVKAQVLHDFKQGRLDVLIGTATLATGTDGLDRVCDRLIIVHDTDDDSLRRQLIGRIMPRGASTDISKKSIVRINMSP